MKQTARSMACALAWLFASQALAQGFGAARIDVSARFDPQSVPAGGTANLVVTITPHAGWHLYGKKDSVGQPPKVTLADGAGVMLVGVPAVPDGEPHLVGSLTAYWLASAFDLTQRVAVPATAAPGDLDVQFQVEYLACTEEFCDPPATQLASAKLTVVAGSAPEAPPTPATFANERLTVAARFEPPRVQGNGKTTLVLKVTPAIGWHVYGAKEKDGQPIAVAEVQGTGVTTEGSAQVPDGRAHAVGALTSYWLGDPFEIRQDVRVRAGTAPGRVDVAVKLAYVACTERNCELPASLTGSVPLVIEAGTAPASAARSSSPTEDAGTNKGNTELPAASLWPLLLAAIGAGLFALVMPCTYPMIPITISFFTKQAAARGSSAVGLALLYGAGIVAMFVLIGVAVGAPIAVFAANPWFNLVVALLFIVFGVSLLGLINLQPPQALMNMAGKASTRGGALGVFLMGALLVITSFTCTAPLIGGLLGGSVTLGGQQVATSTGQIALAMMVFGLTMALPFVALSLVPGKLQALPKSGEWMNTLKVFFGFVELAAALKFISNTDLVWQWQALPRELFLWLWAGLFVVAGCYLLGMIRLHGEEAYIGPGRLLSGLGSILFAAYCVFGALGNRLDFVMTALAPNYSVASSASSDGGGENGKLLAKHVIVADDHARALQLAKEQSKLVLLNFTGFT
jgi:thiol:disulfide interchange protein DsbD